MTLHALSMSMNRTLGWEKNVMTSTDSRKQWQCLLTVTKVSKPRNIQLIPKQVFVASNVAPSWEKCQQKPNDGRFADLDLKGEKELRPKT